MTSHAVSNSSTSSNPSQTLEEEELAQVNSEKQNLQKKDTIETEGVAPNTRYSKLPDFRPLGTVRDYFTELMRQDLGR